MAEIKQVSVSGTSYDIRDALAIPAASDPNGGELRTKYRIAKKDYTGGGSTYWYYEICKLPKNDSGNYASAIITGRIGGWESGNMSYISALIWNRGTPGLAVIDVGGTATAASTIYSICDLVLYTNSDGTATLYAKCANWFTFDFDLEIFQSTASITYTGNKLTSVSGTLNKTASNTTSRMELINGDLYVSGTKMSKSGLQTGAATPSTSVVTPTVSTVTLSTVKATTSFVTISAMVGSYCSTTGILTISTETNQVPNKDHIHGISGHSHTISSHSHTVNSHTHVQQ